MNPETATVLAVENPLDFMARPTPQLRAAVARQQAALPAADFAEMMGQVRAIFEKYSARLLGFAAGAERGRALHQLMDHEMKAAAQLPLACGKGCSGCCSYEVEITPDEAAVLRDVVLGGKGIDRRRLALQAARPRQSAEWKNFFNPDNRCVFLAEDGACGVYAARPSICRKHVVTTPASACVTDGAVVAPVQVLLAEILLSAELSIAGTEFGSLSKMLTKALEAVGAPTNETGAAVIVELAGAAERRVPESVPV